MRNISIFFLFLPFLAVAQTPVSVSMGVGYSDDVYVSLANGEVSTITALNWDLAFDVRSAFSNIIRINDGQGVELSIYPNSDISGWDMADSTGFQDWPRLRNEITSWDAGAFNRSSSPDNLFDFSWGIYTGDPLHDVVGDSLYFVTGVDGATYKLSIDLLDDGAWTFRYADADGSNPSEVTIAMSDYSDRNFVYFNLGNGTVIDREPPRADWDMVFTRYWGMTAFGPGAPAGCLRNLGVELIQADGVDINDVAYADYAWDTEDISVIGNDWKELNQAFEWEVVPERAYFVKDQIGDIYQVVFTSFEGSGSGDLSYNVWPISGAAVTENDRFSDFVVYPNPNATGQLNISANALNATDTQIDLFDMTGRSVYSNRQTFAAGSNTLQLATGAFPAGMYLVALQAGPQRLVRSIVIQ